MKINFVLIATLLLFQFACGESQSPKPENTSSNRATNNAANKPNATSQEVTDPAIRNKVKAQSDSLNKAFTAKDYAKVIDLSYPKEIEKMGGKEKVVLETTQFLKKLDADEFVLISRESSDPTQIISVDKQMFAIVPITQKVKTPQGIVATELFMIGVSEDGGENWKFLGGFPNSATSKKALSNLFPAEIINELKLPEQKNL